MTKNDIHYVSSSPVGDVQICEEVERRHHFHTECYYLHFISETCAFAMISSLPVLGFAATANRRTSLSLDSVESIAVYE